MPGHRHVLIPGQTIAIVKSAGNVMPHEIGRFPVMSIRPNGAGITGYVSSDGSHNFKLSQSSWERSISLRAIGHGEKVNETEKINFLNRCE
jgi:hypothetical protein